MGDGVTTGVRERERKFEAPEDVRLPDPGELFGLRVGGHDEVELDATYYDTADLGLARAGLTLRRRAGGDDEGWHLKLPVDADTRDEIRRPLDPASTAVPEELVGLVRVHTRDAVLEPVAKILTRRRRWQLVDAGGTRVAEVAEDGVHGVRLSPASGEENWRELEVELVGDAPGQLLDAVESELRGLGVLRSDAPSKLSRVLGDRLPAPAPGREHRTAGDVVLDHLRTQVTTLRAQDPLVRLDATDAVHTMRVTARRLRSILQGHHRLIDRAATAAVVDDMRWLGAELGAARDTEVMAARFAAAVDAVPDVDVLGPVQAQITRRFGRQQQEGRSRALAALDSHRYLDLQARLDDLLDRPPLTRHAADKPRPELRRAVRKAWRRTAARHDALASAGDAAARDAALHEVRKAAKRARYVTEVAESVLGKRASRMRKRIKDVQTVLGDHQDTVVARPVLRELGAQAHSEGHNGFTFGILYAREAAAAEELRARLPRAWKRLAKRARSL
ncbi:MAG: CYTH and CHAD domain-containing protein [Pseudonocardiaceae bacterium]|nr:MAG: CYTH and CHAD domain-containing protein [Pseudonocardiaceae bacterium]